MEVILKTQGIKSHKVEGVRFMKQILALAVFSYFLIGCEKKAEKKWIDLPNQKEVNYQLSMRTGEEKYTIAQPFELGVQSGSKDGYVYHIFFAEQCKNVDLFHNDKILIVFYDNLSLTGFSGNDGAVDMPRPLICDNQYSFCRSLKNSLKNQGMKSIPLCTLK